MRLPSTSPGIRLIVRRTEYKKRKEKEDIVANILTKRSFHQNLAGVARTVTHKPISQNLRFSLNKNKGLCTDQTLYEIRAKKSVQKLNMA